MRGGWRKVVVRSAIAAMLCANCTTPGPAGAVNDHPVFPPEVNKLADERIEAVANRALNGSLWGRLELARRFEFGEGMAPDRECAFFWYVRAARTWYNDNAPLGKFWETGAARAHPAAKDGIRRILTAGARLEQSETGPTPKPLQQRCSGDLEASANRWKFGGLGRDLPLGLTWLAARAVEHEARRAQAG